MGDWPDGAAGSDDLMVALHARRSAPAIQAWHAARGSRGLAVVLTGTDLYGDIAMDPVALHSLELAQRLVVLQELGVAELPQAMRAKARVVFQSTGTRQTLDKTGAHLRAVMVGHLREVKRPATLFDAARLLAGRPDILIDHIGEATEPALGAQALALGRECPSYRWLGGLPHEAVRKRIQRAHVLVHTSRLEGGAHVVMEAVCSATPVLASRVPGNVGMLGGGYEGYFAHGDAAGLAALLQRCRTAQGEPLQAPSTNFLGRLRAQCAERAPLFAPATERAAVQRLLQELLKTL